MILLIDNYDSFTYNLKQLIAEENDDILVVRNDEITLDEIRDLKPEAIVLSPGPGRPDQAGICMAAVQTFGKEIPVLGICLGHQAIAEALGGKVGYAKELVHGKKMKMKKVSESALLEGLDEFDAARYHSLAITELPECLEVTAVCDDEIMAVQHRDYPIYGLQFHPESVMTPCGSVIIHNFLKGIHHD